MLLEQVIGQTVDSRPISSRIGVMTHKQCDVETGQMSAVETGQMSAVETRRMSSADTTDVFC